jgi:hypothetical protein
MCRSRYLPSTDATWAVRFPGAEYVTINFDPRSKTEESEGEPHDYVTIYKDASCTDHWGPAKRIGGMEPSNWPGANGPGFTVPGDSVVVHFHSDATVEEWGFKLTLVAPVCMPSVAALLSSAVPAVPILGDAPPEVRTLVCQRALVATRNDMGPAAHERALPLPPDGQPCTAAEYLCAHADELLEAARTQVAAAQAQAEASEAAAGSAGLFTDPMGNIEANLQTGEVYLRKRMLMPTPREITAHADFAEVFGGAAPFCAVTSANENRYWVTIIHGEHSYEVMAWTPFQFDEAGNSAKLPGETSSSLLLGGLPDQRCHSMPQRQLLPGGQTGLRWGGTTYRPYDPKTEEAFGWATKMLQPLLRDTVEQLEMDEPPLLWVSEEGPDSALDLQLLMYASGECQD